MTKIVNLKIADLKPYPENPRDNDNAVPGVVASIRQYGFIGAIIVNKDKVIINGHTRVKSSTTSRPSRNAPCGSPTTRPARWRRGTWTCSRRS